MSHCEQVVRRGILKTMGLSRKIGNDIGVIGVPGLV